MHASQKVEKDAYELVLDSFGIEPPPPAEIERGGIVGESTILDCVSKSSSPWFSGPYGFVLGGSRPLPFQSARGRLGFFEFPK